MSKSKKHGEVKTLVPNEDGQLVETQEETSTQAETTQSRKRGKRELNPDDPFLKQEIVIKAQSNPKRKGSKAFQRFELYAPNMTVADFLKAGGTRGDINWDSQHEHIELRQPIKAETTE